MTNDDLRISRNLMGVITNDINKLVMNIATEPGMIASNIAHHPNKKKSEYKPWFNTECIQNRKTFFKARQEQHRIGTRLMHKTIYLQLLRFTTKVSGRHSKNRTHN